MSEICKTCGIKLGYDIADDWDKGICGTCPKPRIKNTIVTCNKCKQEKRLSEVQLPKGYNPTFLDGYYRCIACFEADELYNHLARENRTLTRELSEVREALRLACEKIDACNGYCPVNAGVKEFTGKCCDCTAAGVYRDYVEKNLKPKGWQESIKVTKQCWQDHFIKQAQGG
jgi:hypothetical protein